MPNLMNQIQGTLPVSSTGAGGDPLGKATMAILRLLGRNSADDPVARQAAQEQYNKQDQAYSLAIQDIMKKTKNPLAGDPNAGS